MLKVNNLYKTHFCGGCSPKKTNVVGNPKRSNKVFETELINPQTPKKVPENSKMPNTLNTSQHNVGQFNIATGNQFDPLSSTFTHPKNDVTRSNAFDEEKNPKMQSLPLNKKIPPITVVGASNFAQAMKLLTESAQNTDYTLKYMSIGTKIMLTNTEAYKKMKQALIAANVEFYSHDLISEKFDRFILSGISRQSGEDIADSLKVYQFEPSEIREINQKKKRFDDEGSYVISFKHGSVTLNNLNRIKINHTIPKWRYYQTSKNNCTQCRRCQLFGHGMRNCNLNPKCGNCASDHLTENCQSPVRKCVNCKGDHQSSLLECPKRNEFIQMRTRLSASNNKSAKPTPAPRKNLGNFPMLNKSTNSIANNQIQFSQNINQWSKVVKQGIKSSTGTTSEKFKPEEIAPIMKELFSGLSTCQNKEQQLIVMFEVATKWIYNNVP